MQQGVDVDRAGPGRPGAADPTLAASMRDARAGAVPALDLTAPSALRPFVVKGLVDAGRTVLAVAATAREAEDLVEALERDRRPGAGRLLPGVGDAAARAALAAQRHRRPPARGAAPAAAPRRPTPPTGPLKVVVAPVRSVLQPQVQRAGRPRAGRARGRRRGRPRRRRTTARGRGLLPGRPGGEARRVRGARRHRRRLPADRGAPAAGGVLGRRGRGDPLLRGRRPAHPGAGRPAVGAAVPRAAAHRRGPRPAPSSSARSTPSSPRSPRSSPTGTRSRAWSPWRRCWSTRWRCSSTCCPSRPTCWCSTPSGPAAGRTTWSRPARSSSGVLGGRGRRGSGADRPRRRVLPLAGRRPGDEPGAGQGLVERVPVRARPPASAGGGAPRDAGARRVARC